MLSKLELAKFLIGLIEVNDADLINDDSILSPEICVADDRVLIRRLRDMIERLYRDFDHLASPEFMAMIDGKSDAYVVMLTKPFREPEKRKEQQKAYGQSIAMLLSDDRTFELTPPKVHKILDDLRAGFRRVTNPERGNAG